jgi:hypothetical protein
VIEDTEYIKAYVASLPNNHDKWLSHEPSFRGGKEFKNVKCANCKCAFKNADGTYLCKAGHGKNNASDYRCGYGERKTK